MKQTSMEENVIGNVKYPPGIRFCPSDEELITHYLQRKVDYLELPAHIIADIDLYKYNPWDLPKKALFGDYEWYFFTPRNKKYPNGGRPNRTAVSGYWKATGKDIPVLSSSGLRTIGLKKVLVFYGGKPKKGVKMDWVMTEYRLPDASRPYRSKGCMRLDDWVLCRVRQKGNMSKNTREEDSSSHEFIEDGRKIEELPSVYTDQSRDIFSDYLLSSEFQLIASLLNGCDPQRESIPQTLTEQKEVESESSRFLVADKDTNSSCRRRGNNFNPNYSENAYVNFQEFDMPAIADHFIQ